MSDPGAEGYEGESQGEGGSWLHKAQEAYRDSTDYYESSLYKEWRSSIAHFRGEHAPGSKYNSELYKKRSKIFRPKIRAAIRTHDATLAAALFTNNEVVNITGSDPNNKFHADAAKLTKAIMQHRLEKTIPWFQTAIGAYQDTNKYGICVSKQYWDYEEHGRDPVYEEAVDESGVPMLDGEGIALGYEVEQDSVISKDKPVIELIPPDNFRYDPNADWRNPVETSP